MVAPVASWLRSWMQLADGDAARATDTLEPLVGAIRSSLSYRLASPLLVVLAEAQLAQGKLDEATTSLDEATTLARSQSLTWVLGRTSLVRAKLRARQGDLNEADSLAHEAIALGREAGDQLGLVDAVEFLAAVAGERDTSIAAVRLLAAAGSRRSELGYRFTTDRAVNEKTLARTREVLAADEFEAAWAEGARLGLDEAIAYAARRRGERKRPAAGWAGLTPSELEVARLVGQHLSNPEIASRLFVSRATVKTHLVHIFGKLGIDSRSELAVEATKHGR